MHPSFSIILLAVYFRLYASNVEALAVSSHSPNNASLYDRAAPLGNRIFDRREEVKLLSQKSANAEMKFISQPVGVEVDQLADYVFMSPAGSGVTVYVHDTGINLQHDEFTQSFDGVRKGTIGRLFPKRSILDPQPANDPTGHGTCVADKIVGHKFGIAKGANLLMVPWIDLDDYEWMQAGLRAIIDDVKAKRKKNPNFVAVANFSYKLGRKAFLLHELQSYRALYKEIYDLDVVMVFASGNEGNYGRNEVKHYPALFAKEFPNMIVVGSVNIDGYPSKFTEGGPLVHISAPGAVSDEVGIECARPTGKSGTWRLDGTSISAPTVAGFAAYLMSFMPALREPGSVAKNVKAKLVKTGYIRMVGDKKDVPLLPAIWNGLEGSLVC